MPSTCIGGGQLQQAKELVSRYNRMLPDPTAESLWLAIRIERKLGDRQAEASLATQLAAPLPELDRVSVAAARKLRLTMSDPAIEPTADAPTGPGHTLAQAREARGMTVTEVALRLKFSPRQIEALEDDRYDALPGPTFGARDDPRLLEADRH